MILRNADHITINTKTNLLKYYIEYFKNYVFIIPNH